VAEDEVPEPMSASILCEIAGCGEGADPDEEAIDAVVGPDEGGGRPGGGITWPMPFLVIS